ncbi:MAG: bifunctional phosphoglucose/phosphomannose isomerase, partial [Candidatus Omnitrophica bacterium]|nr:bifunctional phosphoglucose/phosphomannose isomerase [Candidatus Omnitrophota bacterium]
MAKQAVNASTIKKLDKSDMLSLLMDFPTQFQAALDIAKNSGILFQKRDFNKIIFAGLGGSAIGADLVRSYLYFQSNIQISVFREYQLPGCIDSQSLVFLSSYSGNTEETLSAYKEARDKGATLIAVSSGGALKELTTNDKVTFVEIPKGLPPRCALGYLSIVPLCLLARLGLIKDVEPAVREAMKLLESLRDNNLNPRISGKDNISKFIAAKLVNNLAVIYSPSVHFDVCAVRFRGQLAENSKALAWHHVLPEMNHNEIVGWENPHKLFKSLKVIMLCDKLMHSRVAKRIGITTELIRKEGVELIEVHSRGEGLLSRMFSLIYIGDFVSYYLALSYGIDPTPVERITYLKNKLAQG